MFVQRLRLHTFTFMNFTTVAVGYLLTAVELAKFDHSEIPGVGRLQGVDPSHLSLNRSDATLALGG